MTLIHKHRIHWQIPLSDLSLAQLYSACLLRTDSVHLFFPRLYPLFSLSLPLQYTALPLCPLCCASEWVPSYHLHPSLYQCARLYCNYVPLLDKCWPSTLLPSDRIERKGETFDWSAGVPLIHFSLTLIPKVLIHFLSMKHCLTAMTELTVLYVRMPGIFTIFYIVTFHALCCPQQTTNKQSWPNCIIKLID